MNAQPEILLVAVLLLLLLLFFFFFHSRARTLSQCQVGMNETPSVDPVATKIVSPQAQPCAQPACKPCGATWVTQMRGSSFVSPIAPIFWVWLDEQVRV
ncbi:hypothetical protein KC19_11G148200 [Ceratodon purpureus]|uniref:ATP synthase F0 subunit 8 n=1 Tax=Ceratodon purpureus TaxID=3225 RepID=A0A8T0GHL4_CERPU|nr:hypothetical protein KC19_11G148200 [Ceratodon purpureus]